MSIFWNSLKKFLDKSDRNPANISLINDPHGKVSLEKAELIN
jgi:hypothetical protein